MICDEGLFAWVDRKKNLTHGCIRVKYAVTPGARREHSSPEVTTEAGWQLLASRGGRRRARRMDPQEEGPWSAAAAERYCALPLLCGDFVGCSLSLLSVSVYRAASQGEHSALSLQLSTLISRYLFTPTFYCHWIPTGQKATCRLYCIDNKVIKTICLIHISASRIRNRGAGGPHADFHLRFCVPGSNYTATVN